MLMGRSATTFVLLLLLAAFAGRPAAYCLMKGTLESTPERQAAHAKPCHGGAPAPESTPSCMVDLGTDHYAPAVEKSPVPALVAVAVAAVPPVRAIAAPRRAPALTRVTAYESPPSSIAILRI